MNSHLVKRNLKVNDFKKDLCDGVLLAQLLEILTNKTIPNIKTKNVGMRAFKFDNVSILLKWIDQELHLRLFGCAPEG